MNLTSGELRTGKRAWTGHSPHDSSDTMALKDLNPLKQLESNGYPSQSHRQWGTLAAKNKDGYNVE